MKRKPKRKTVKTTWEYDDRTVIHIKVSGKPDLLYFSGTAEPENWNKPIGYDKYPKGNFITRFAKRLWRKFKYQAYI